MARKLVVLALFGAACASGATGNVNTAPPAARAPGTAAMPAPTAQPSAVQPPTTAVAFPRSLPLGPGNIQGAVWPDEGPPSWAPRPTEAGITANDMRTRLYQISDDSMQGRRVATEGGFKATSYVGAEFQRLGLRPAGDNGSFFQEIEFGQLGFDSSTVNLSTDSTALQPRTDWVPIAPAAAQSIGGRFTAQNVQVVFGGRRGDSTVALDPAMVRGKVVVLLPALPNPDAAAGRGAGRAGGGAAGGRGGGRGGAQAAPTDLRAQQAGAMAVFFVNDSITEGMANTSFNSRTGLMPFVTSTTAAANISAAAAARMFDRPLDQLTVGTAGRTVSGSWAYTYTRPEFPARNVIAVLPGSDPALRGQYILVGAHNDHVGMVNGPRRDHDSVRAYNTVMRPQGANDPNGTPTADQQRRIDSLLRFARSIRPPRLDSVMNGADDDGSGTALLIEIAEQFVAQGAPRRSIVFISHAAEESGLLGSQYFTNHPTIPRDSIVAAHNMDMVGNGGVSDVKFGGPSQVQMLGARRLSSEFGDVIDSINAVRAETMAIDYSWDRTNALNRFCRSDQVNYFRFAIPVTYFSTGYSPDYHMATDEPQYIDYDHSARVGRFVHEIMRTLANRPNRLAVLPLEQRDLSARCGT